MRASRGTSLERDKASPSLKKPRPVMARTAKIADESSEEESAVYTRPRMTKIRSTSRTAPTVPLGP